MFLELNAVELYLKYLVSLFIAIALTVMCRKLTEPHLEAQGRKIVIRETALHQLILPVRKHYVDIVIF